MAQSRNFRKGNTAMEVLQGMQFKGKTFMITGANCGIGYETARAIALHGGHVVMACRNMEAAMKAVKQIQIEDNDVSIDVIHLDNSSLHSVEECAREYVAKQWPLHVLILNAGVVNPPHRITDDGFEATFQVNHLAHFHLTNLLTPLLTMSAPSRVVVVSSDGHRTPYNFGITWEKLSPRHNNRLNNSWAAYCNSKLCNVLFANELDKRLSKDGVRVNSLDPGMVRTDIGRNFSMGKCWFCCLAPAIVNSEAGSATQTYCATAPELSETGGHYFVFCKEQPASAKARDHLLAQKLWTLSEEMVKRHSLNFEKTIDVRLTEL